MATKYSPRIVTDGLLVSLDAASARSYSGSGDWVDLATTGHWAKYGNPVFIPHTTAAGAACWDFDATGDYFKLNNHTTNLDPGTGDMTWEAWFQTDATSGDGYIYSNFENNGHRVEMRAGTGGKVCRMLLRGAAQMYNDTSTVASAGVWYHLIVRYDRDAANVNAGITFYVNGVYDGGTIPSAVWVQNDTIAPGSTADTVGARGNASSLLNGRIAVFRIYNKKFTAAEVTQNYNALKGRFNK